MLQPKDRKFRKEQRGRMKGNAKAGTRLEFGDFGLKAVEPSWITGRQIEAGRIV
ncbi:MAG: ribosomal protein L16, partial [bacterium]